LAYQVHASGSYIVVVVIV